MADIRIRKRKRMRSKEIKALSEELKVSLGIDTFAENDAVDLAESTDYDVIFVNNDILGLVVDGRPFLTVRGVIKYKPSAKSVTVDMGAVPYLMNGADVMGPGITDADDAISEGDMVWIKDIKNGVPLAIGKSLRSAAALKAKEKGKAIELLQYVGDKLWKTGE